MKTTFSPDSATRTNAAGTDRLLAPAGFSRRLARPSLSVSVSSLNDPIRIDDLWDGALLDRLHSPLTRFRD